jgi:hypothetical protein
VLQGIRQMEKVTQTTAATAEESAAASEQLNAQAGVTMRLVERLEVMVGHDDGAAPLEMERPGPVRKSPRIAMMQPGARVVRRAPMTADERAVFPADGTYGQF